MGKSKTIFQDIRQMELDKFIKENHLYYDEKYLITSGKTINFVKKNKKSRKF